MNNNILDVAMFYWKDHNSENTCTLHNRTLEDAKKVAESFGWKEFKWYKPSTWKNTFFIQQY